MKSLAQRQADYKSRQAKKGLYRIQIYLKDEIKNAIDMEVEVRNKEFGEKITFSEVANELIFKALQDSDIASGISVESEA
jgi:hypothetical protein